MNSVPEQDGGWRLFEQELTVLQASADWMQLDRGEGPESVPLALSGDVLTGRMGDIGLKVEFSATKGVLIDSLCMRISLENKGVAEQRVNLRWSVLLGDQSSTPEWLIPALWYKHNHQEYPGCPTLSDEVDLKRMASPYWLFRSDLTALPMVMAQVGDFAIAEVLPAYANDHECAVGFDHRQQRRALLASWPEREEPRRRKTDGEPQEALESILVNYSRVEPDSCVGIDVHFYVQPNTPHAYSPILRTWFNHYDKIDHTKPWYPLLEGASHAAFGLYNWHYDPESSCLWETSSYASCYSESSRQFVRTEMHTAFVSGIPHAYAMQQHGRRSGDNDLVEAGNRVIEFCCSSLTPCGTFWSKYAPDYGGWTTGWPQPQRPLPGPDMAAPSGELHARTLAEATRFAAMAARASTESELVDHWTQVVCSNLDFVLRVAQGGNPGQNYLAEDGRVLDWDGEEGILWIAAMVEGWRLTGDERYRDFAVAAGHHFRAAVNNAYITGAPEAMHLLPTSEDPQNAVISYVNLWEATEDAQWLEVAREAAEWFMTFRWQYNVRFPRYSLLEAYDYRSKGIDVSSPNNIHVHPYSVFALPEMLRLWEAIGDDYLVKQAANNLHACNQMLAPVGGAFDAQRGMMTERWSLTDCAPGKGSSMPISHSWTIGVVLYADMAAADFGGILINGATGAVTVLEALACEEQNGRWVVTNPWKRPVSTSVLVREARAGRLAVDGTEVALDGDKNRYALSFAPYQSIEIQWLGGSCPPISHKSASASGLIPG